MATTPNRPTQGSRIHPFGARRGIDRREFLRRGAATGMGLGLLPLAEARATIPPRPEIRRRVVLGRTGLEVPDIGFGTSRLAGDVDLVRYALDHGITYFDTAKMYTEGSSEETLGRALEGRRDEVILATKVLAKGRESRQELMESLEGSLRRLRTDHVEIFFNHAVNDVRRLQNPEWPEFVALAKAQGKIRFSGMSGHGGRLVECLDYAIDNDLIDVMLVGYNFGQDPAFHERLTRSMDFVATQPELPRVLAKARQKNLGVIAMKTLRGGRLNDLRAYEEKEATFAQAAFRWTLSSPNVNSLIVTMKNTAMVDEYLGASGWTQPKSADIGLLERYEARNGERQCRYGCNDCTNACPAGVAISDVLRARMYAEDYDDLDFGRESYSGIAANASPCVTCSHQACSGGCPHGLSIPALTGAAQRLLG
jgi:predicted aldo/keto reductase-like oxidoreductase